MRFTLSGPGFRYEFARQTPREAAALGRALVDHIGEALTLAPHEELEPGKGHQTLVIEPPKEDAEGWKLDDPGADPVVTETTNG